MHFPSIYEVGTFLFQMITIMYILRSRILLRIVLKKFEAHKKWSLVSIRILLKFYRLSRKELGCLNSCSIKVNLVSIFVISALLQI